MTDQNTALKVANYLLQIKAIKLEPGNPFTWASGWKSPIYCDNRKTLSHPDIRSSIKEVMKKVIEENYPETEVIAGVATGGIAIGALVADAMNLPFVYVRSSSKGHGLQNKIEGELKEGSKVTVIEDLISTGKSSLDAVAALRAANATVNGMVAIFTYGFDVSVNNFENENCKLITLSNYGTLIKEALNNNYISESDVASLNNWRNDPANWQPEK